MRSSPKAVRAKRKPKPPRAWDPRRKPKTIRQTPAATTRRKAGREKERKRKSEDIAALEDRFSCITTFKCMFYFITWTNFDSGCACCCPVGKVRPWVIVFEFLSGLSKINCTGVSWTCSKQKP
ncbi:unnamed protein product [Amoebophrya sp. A120]|nr:unnamed protein product [Amoebophrya sp. A120]|eukprot:GSA120T00014217001.1